MPPVVSLLIGSGFSIPEGLPGVRDLNKRLSKIDESEILIHTSQVAFFLNGQEDPNRWSRQDERIFLQEFLEFYNREVLPVGQTFHYETFYDFYSGYLRNGENKEPIETFYNQFNSKYFREGNGLRDCYNRVADFNRTFNQLLASQLHKTKYHNDISYLNYPPYEVFVQFLVQLLRKSEVKIHSLNHDLFFDWLGRKHSKLWESFSDGFELAGSPFYGTVGYDFNKGTENEVTKEYYVKLEQFVGKFDKPLCLYKLHGSVFNTIVYVDKKRVRLRDNYRVSQYYREINDREGYRFELILDEVAPDFLSGTTNKTLHYTRDPYYVDLLKHFQTNLESSVLLIVVGYGFNDRGINDYLESNYLSRGRRMIVIDPGQPSSELLKKYDVIHIKKGVTELHFKEYLEILPKDLSPDESK